MTKWIETTGRSEEDAITAALFQLGLERDDVSIEVLERAKSGFLGFGASPARVRVSYEVVSEEEAIHSDAPSMDKEVQSAEDVVEEVAPIVAQPVTEEEEETILPAKPDWVPTKKQGYEHQPKKRQELDHQLQAGDEVIIGNSECVPENQTVENPVFSDDEKATKVHEFLVGLMERLEVQATVQIGVTEDGNYKVLLLGDGLGSIIGRRGETLDAIQQLTNYAVNRGQSKRVRVHVDAEGYRAKREESLQHLALKVAGKVVKYRKNVMLEPMNAYERHVIHAALQDVPKVSTYSTGVDPNRRTVVAYTPDKS